MDNLSEEREYINKQNLLYANKKHKRIMDLGIPDLYERAVSAFERRLILDIEDAIKRKDHTTHMIDEMIETLKSKKTKLKKESDAALSVWFDGVSNRWVNYGEFEPPPKAFMHYALFDTGMDIIESESELLTWAKIGVRKCLFENISPLPPLASKNKGPWPKEKARTEFVDEIQMYWMAKEKQCRRTFRVKLTDKAVVAIIRMIIGGEVKSNLNDREKDELTELAFDIHTSETEALENITRYISKGRRKS